MAQALNKTKRRIASVKSTKKITEAMELVATVKLKKFKGVMERNEAYTKEMHNIISSLFGMLNEDETNLYGTYGKSNKDLFIVINSNLGLCASYNSNVYNFVNNNVPKTNSIILPIGLKGLNIYKKEGYELNDNFININDKLSYEDCVRLSRYINTEYLKNKYHSIKLIYTKYINSLKFEPKVVQILPVIEEGTKVSFGYTPIFDSNVKTLIEELIPISITSLLYQSIIESQVSEQASRRNAMENANDNADEIIDKLTIEYNKARQAAITQEITEVVASQAK